MQRILQKKKGFIHKISIKLDFYLEDNFMREFCNKCGAEYEVQRIKLPMRDKDSEHCECGNLLKSWNGAEMWDYQLIKHGNTYKEK